MSNPISFRWASVSGAQGMVTVDEAEWLGYVKVRKDPRFPGSWLMRRDG